MIGKRSDLNKEKITRTPQGYLIVILWLEFSLEHALQFTNLGLFYLRKILPVWLCEGDQFFTCINF